MLPNHKRNDLSVACFLFYRLNNSMYFLLGIWCNLPIAIFLPWLIFAKGCGPEKKKNLTTFARTNVCTVRHRYSQIYQRGITYFLFLCFNPCVEDSRNAILAAKPCAEKADLCNNGISGCLKEIKLNKFYSSQEL